MVKDFTSLEKGQCEKRRPNYLQHQPLINELSYLHKNYLYICYLGPIGSDRIIEIRQILAGECVTQFCVADRRY